jgi:hypothetical protein
MFKSDLLWRKEIVVLEVAAQPAFCYCHRRGELQIVVSGFIIVEDTATTKAFTLSWLPVKLQQFDMHPVTV